MHEHSVRLAIRQWQAEDAKAVEQWLQEECSYTSAQLRQKLASAAKFMLIKIPLESK